MIIKHVEKIYVYNRWAWGRVWPSLERVDSAEYHLERPFFWGSLHGLAVHAVAAEWNWLARLERNFPADRIEVSVQADLPTLIQTWRTLQTKWDSYFAELSESKLVETITLRPAENETVEMAVRDILQHVVNHSGEHRSQMTPTLSLLGAPTKPLDYLYFCLEQTG